jgi:hypothetical protein
MIQVEARIVSGSMTYPTIITYVHVRSIRMSWGLAEIFVSCRWCSMLFCVLLRRLRPLAPHALGSMGWNVAAPYLGVSTRVLLTPAMLLRVR